jgi:hypothetical protein
VEVFIMIRQWRQTTQGDPKLTHDVDCHFWKIQLCTCGLLHHLSRIGGEQVYYGDLGEDLGNHDAALYAIATLRRDDPAALSQGEGEEAVCLMMDQETGSLPDAPEGE